MNKRGISTQQYIWTFYIILCVLLFVLLINYIRQEVTGEAYQQQILSKKLGLTLDTVYASNGELELKYNFNKTYFIKSKDGFLTIMKEKIGSQGFYIIAQDENNLNFNLETDSIKIKSKNGDISVT
ncbi:MAG: hypothetical protein ISS82_02880 [Nanoarchaeota archaeon]|nr:hypothetical protein [Nanoarchaeota archaeon]